MNDRPVRLVATADGGLDCLVLDLRTGAFIPDRSYFLRVSEAGIGKDVDSLDAESFGRLVAAHRSDVLARLAVTGLVWHRTGDGESPFQTEHAGQPLTVRVNDLPNEPLYTVLACGQEVGELEDWPAAWIKPAAGTARA